MNINNPNPNIGINNKNMNMNDNNAMLGNITNMRMSIDLNVDFLYNSYYQIHY